MLTLLQKKNKAFTLVEVLIAIAVMGIMTSVAIVSFGPAKSDARLKAAQREIAATIKSAQGYALQGKVQNGQTPCAYGFRFTTEEDYEIFYKSSIEGANCSSLDVNSFHTIETFKFKNGVKLNNFPDKDLTEIYFSIPFGKMFIEGGVQVVEANDDLGANTNFVKQYEVSFGGGSKHVGIKPGGYVIEYDN